LVDGQNYESNNNLVIRCRERLQSLSPGGPSGAYDYFAKTIPTEDPPKVKSGLRSIPNNSVTRTKIIPVTGGL